MPLKSLYQLCLDQLSEAIEGDHQDIYPDDRFCYLALSSFNVHWNEKSNKVIPEFWKCSSLTKVVLDPQFFEYDPDDLKEFDKLEYLKLNSFNKQTLTDIQTALRTEYRCFRSLKLDLLTIFKKFLSPGARGTLKSLEFHDCHLSSRNCLMKTISQLMPNLISLDIAHTKLSNIEQRAIFAHFGNLKSLSLAMIDMTNLTGISNLVHLEHLDLMGNRFADKTTFREIFELKKLKTLNLSGYGYFQTVFSLPPPRNFPNLKTYMQCRSFLPELEYLDVSCNVITVEQLKRLVKTHPKLKKIGLIGTALVDRAPFPNGTPRLLNGGTLWSCLESLEQFTSHADRFKVPDIISRIKNHLTTNYAEQKEDTLQKCFKLLLPKPDKKAEWTKHQRDYIDCLYELFRDSRHRKFSTEDQVRLLDTLLNTCSHSFFVQEDLTDREFVMHNKIWQILNNDELIQISKWNYGLICDKALKTVDSCRKPDPVVGELFDTCTELLVRYLEKSGEVLKTARDNIVLRDHILGFINRGICQSRPKIYRACLHLSRILICGSRLENHQWCRRKTEQTIVVWLRNLGDFERKEEMMREVYEVIVSYVKEHGRALIFKQEQFGILTHYIHLEPCALQKTAVEILVRSLFHADSVPQAVKDVLADLEKCPHVLNDTGKLAVYKWLKENGSRRRTKLWAESILEHFKEEEGPDAKRRREN